MSRMTFSFGKTQVRPTNHKMMISIIIYIHYIWPPSHWNGKTLLRLQRGLSLASVTMVCPEVWPLHPMGAAQSTHFTGVFSKAKGAKSRLFPFTCLIGIDDLGGKFTQVLVSWVIMDIISFTTDNILHQGQSTNRYCNSQKDPKGSLVTRQN